MRPKYSIVVPFHDEQESVRELHARLSSVMTGRFEPVEFIYVDDQSSDATPAILTEIALEDPRVNVVRLKRNYGQTTALAAGFDYASGEIIISMDGDLQHDPDDIPMMLETFESTGSDIVSGWRQKRVDNFIMRRLPSRVANWMMAKLSGVDIITVSMDLPFAQARWKAAEGIAHQTLSAHKSEQFGRAYGVLIKEWRLLQRAVFVIDGEGRVIYAEYVADQMREPDYEAALHAVQTASGHQ